MDSGLALFCREIEGRFMVSHVFQHWVHLISVKHQLVLGNFVRQPMRQWDNEPSVLVHCISHQIFHSRTSLGSLDFGQNSLFISSKCFASSFFMIKPTSTFRFLFRFSAYNGYRQENFYFLISNFQLQYPSYKSYTRVIRGLVLYRKGRVM